MSLQEHIWLNPPPHHLFAGEDLHVRTGDRTDFWRETFYDFWRDNGHFLHRRVEGDFTVEVNVLGRFEILYDQAGLMVRLSQSHWVKAGIEYTDGQIYLSVVVTNDTSDWSLASIPLDPAGTRIRMTRHREAIRVQYLDSSNRRGKPVRLAYLPPSDEADVGVMCCSPQREGFEVTFSQFAVGPAIARELHD